MKNTCLCHDSDVLLVDAVRLEEGALVAVRLGDQCQKNFFLLSETAIRPFLQSLKGKNKK